MTDGAARRAAHLVRLYPRQWRRRYPDFVEVLAAELAEHRRGVVGDVVRAASVERLRAMGLLPGGPSDRARSGLALIYAALVPFAGLALGLWSQLHTGLARGGPDAGPVLRDSVVVLEVGTLVALAALPLGVGLTAVHARRSRAEKANSTSGRPRWTLLRPAAVLVASLSALSGAGWAAARSGWYSPAALALPRHGPGHLATLWIRAIVAAITPAWIHPSLFARMPTGELVAALLAPFAAVAAAGALLRMILALPLRIPRRADVALGVGTVGMMLLAVAAAVRWVLAHPTREGTTALLAHQDQLAPGHTGWAVVFLLAVLIVIALAGTRRVVRARGALLEATDDFSALSG